MKFKLIALAAALTLPACTHLNLGKDESTKYAVTCTAVAAVLDTATANIDKLSKEQVAKINVGAESMQKVCGSSTAPTDAYAKRAALDEAYRLIVENLKGMEDK